MTPGHRGQRQQRQCRSRASLADGSSGGDYTPFALFFANDHTMYVTDEGTGNSADAAHAGLEKWILGSTSIRRGRSGAPCRPGRCPNPARRQRKHRTLPTGAFVPARPVSSMISVGHFGDSVPQAV
jgi:hypothetical protein